MSIASPWTPRRTLAVLVGACFAALPLLHPGHGFAAAGDLRAVTLEADGAAVGPAVSNKGQTVFTTDARLALADANSYDDTYEAGADGTVRQWSAGWRGAISDGSSGDIDIAGGGGRVVFSSTATNLWGSDNNGNRDIYLCKRGNGQCQTVGWVTWGTEPNGASYRPRISADGRWVVFSSDASNWVRGDTNGVRDVFIADASTGKVSRVSVDADGKQLSHPSDHPQVSADGSLVTFSTRSPAVRRDSNGLEDVYLRNRSKGTTTIASLARNGGLADRPSFQSAVAKRCVSGTCRPTVAFVSRAANLVPGDTNNARDVFIREGNSTGRASVSADGKEGAPKKASWGPTLSADARYIAFATHADIAGPGSSVPQVMLRDRSTGTVTLHSALGGVPGDRISTQPYLSPNGRHLAFKSRATNLDTTDADNRTWDVFVSQVW
jgi:Tol biopolymer transport system component